MVQNDNPAKFAQLDDEITLVQMNLVTQQNLLGWTMKFDHCRSFAAKHELPEVEGTPVLLAEYWYLRLSPILRLFWPQAGFRLCSNFALPLWALAPAVHGSADNVGASTLESTCG